MNYPFALDRKILDSIREDALSIASDIDARIDPLFDGAKADNPRLFALGAREWKNILSIEHALRLSSLSNAAQRAAQFAIQTIPRLDGITPWRYFEWFGVGILSGNDSLIAGLANIANRAFELSGSAPSTAARLLADAWRSIFGEHGFSTVVLDEPTFQSALESDNLDIVTSRHLFTLWNATSTLASRDPDGLEQAIRERFEFLREFYSSDEDRYLPEALLDLPLAALLGLGIRYGVRLQIETPYVPEIH